MEPCCIVLSAHDNAERQAEPYLTIAQVADALRVSRWSVTRYIKAGKLGAIKMAGRNGAVRIPLGSYQEFLQRQVIRPEEDQCRPEKDQ